MGTGSSAARGFEGVDPAKRRQAAPPPRRYADPARYDWIPVEGDPDPADVASASEAPPGFAAPDDDGGGASPRSHSFSKPRESLNAELAREDAATAESLAAAAASRASGLAGELQLRREVVMMPA
uniref:Uncharacterized protein n=1 Tax=Pelagomonas calceolata TaxID=35677 RepID=A0A7S4EDF7_9STRA|mmetsp:Transcript_8448/g.25117  ORF Transcript_8448/g.25117 Transcript_8448/m.25117 type:complete len:125 (-) Transcript_8448:22-396(-)